uniref:Uncharacterized protein n=1 Tax=Strigamia maritima TaxID=126957 RepID=T1IXE7_STRMM
MTRDRDRHQHSAIFESKNRFLKIIIRLSPSNARKISITLGHKSRTGLAQEDSCPDQAPRFVSLSRSGASRSFSLLFWYLSVSWGRDGALGGWVPVEAGLPIALQFVLVSREPQLRARLFLGSVPVEAGLPDRSSVRSDSGESCSFVGGHCCFYADFNEQMCHSCGGFVAN